MVPDSLSRIVVVIKTGNSGGGRRSGTATQVGGPLGQTRGFSSVNKGGNIAGGIRIQVEEFAALILEYLGQIHSTLRTNSLHLSDMIWMGENCHQQHFVTLSYPNDEME